MDNIIQQFYSLGPTNKNVKQSSSSISAALISGGGNVIANSLNKSVKQLEEEKYESDRKIAEMENKMKGLSQVQENSKQEILNAIKNSSLMSSQNIKNPLSVGSNNNLFGNGPLSMSGQGQGGPNQGGSWIGTSKNLANLGNLNMNNNNTNNSKNNNWAGNQNNPSQMNSMNNMNQLNNMNNQMNNMNNLNNMNNIPNQNNNWLGNQNMQNTNMQNQNIPIKSPSVKSVQSAKRKDMFNSTARKEDVDDLNENLEFLREELNKNISTLIF